MELSSEKISNSSLQADEIQALSSIFGKEFKLDQDNRFSIKILNRWGNEVYLEVMLPENYSLNSSPECQLSAPWMSRTEKLKLSTKIEEICSQNMGESIVYVCVEAIKDFIENEVKPEVENDDISTNSFDSVVENTSLNEVLGDLPIIEHGEPIIDRKSVFQAHLSKVVSENQVKLVLAKLKENSKIDSAEHNVYAYRIPLKNGHFNQDYNDDGETRAGSVLLHLLQISDLSNILIVVSRWYGGIHLGPDRFRHYNNAARNLLSCAGYLKKEKKLSGAKR